MQGSALLLRKELGEVLREERQKSKKTLRQLSTEANVALSYLSEVERGQKEVSSEVLLSISGALDIPLSDVLSTVADRLSVFESVKEVFDRKESAKK